MRLSWRKLKLRMNEGRAITAFFYALRTVPGSAFTLTDFDTLRRLMAFYPQASGCRLGISIAVQGYG